MFQLAAPQTVAMDDVGRVLMVEGDGGLNSTLIFRFCVNIKFFKSNFENLVSLLTFSPSGDHLGDLPLLGTPHKILVQVVILDQKSEAGVGGLWVSPNILGKSEVLGIHPEGLASCK